MIRFLSLFLISLKSYFLEFTDCNDSDAYAVIVHIRLLLKAELTSAISQNKSIFDFLLKRLHIYRKLDT